ncbi:hypothetical protein TNCV_3971181 [Trichonephila clavipes]|nr:hypothetical protein TNCV_3971181 [Trichonephila clavipes]
MGNVTDWQKVVFSDESWFVLGTDDNRVRVWRCPGQRYVDDILRPHVWGCGSPVVRVSDHGRYVMSSSPVPLKTRRVGQRCTLNLSRAETSSR